MKIMTSCVRIATRASALAMAQTEQVRRCLQLYFPETEFKIIQVKTSGDQNRDWVLEQQGGQGLFTAEVERAILDGEADLAIHSAKDLPACTHPQTEIAGYLPREDVRDVLVVQEGGEQLHEIATSSPRRQAQGQRLYPSANWTNIRGNVHTRIRKVASGEVQATFLAQAGLNRLSIAKHEGVDFKPMDITQMVPAGGQGAIAVQTRVGELPAYSPYLCPQTHQSVSIEKKLLQLLGVGCHTAIGVHYRDEFLYIFDERLPKVLKLSFTSATDDRIETSLKEIIREYNLSE